MEILCQGERQSGQRWSLVLTVGRELCTIQPLGTTVKGGPALLLFAAEQLLKYLLLGLKMKKALASGMGTAFSLRCSSDIGRGRGPTGISGSSSSSSAARNISIFYFILFFFFNFMHNTTPYGVPWHFFLLELELET